MARAVLMFDGPKRGSKFCEGCSLYEPATKAQDRCPIWGDLYRETSGMNEGDLCRADECRDNEDVVADPDKRESLWHALEAGS